jgi:hypothetical protein
MIDVIDGKLKDDIVEQNQSQLKSRSVVRDVSIPNTLEVKGVQTIAQITITME